MNAKTLCIIALSVITLCAAPARAIKFYQDINMKDTNLINAGGNKITNSRLAPRTWTPSTSVS